MKKTFQISIAILFLILFVPLLAQSIIFAAEVDNKTISISLDQTTPTRISLISVTLENNNPERYMITLPNNYFNVREVDANGVILYEGQVKNTKLESVVVSGNTSFIEVPENPLVINFPYFDEAKKIRIFDEANTLLLDIDLARHGVGPTPMASARVTDCNKCGYCIDKKPPGDLNKCMACLYPEYVNNPEGTLTVDPIKNKPVKPRIGAYYTQVGCIDVGLSGFRDSSAAGGVTNAILSRFLFPITGVLALLSLIYGAFLVMTAHGRAQQINLGKRWIYGALIGVVFVFMVILLIRIIAGDILRIPGFDI